LMIESLIFFGEVIALIIPSWSTMIE